MIPLKDEYKKDCPQYLRDYLTYVRVVRNHTERTEEGYYIDLRTFLRYLKIHNGDVPEGTDFEDIKIADVPISYLFRSISCSFTTLYKVIKVPLTNM